MSDYYRLTKHPETGNWEQALWSDNYYGAHNYGVIFDDGDVFDPRSTKLETKESTNDVNQNDELREAIRCKFIVGISGRFLPSISEQKKFVDDMVQLFQAQLAQAEVRARIDERQYAWDLINAVRYGNKDLETAKREAFDRLTTLQVEEELVTQAALDNKNY